MAASPFAVETSPSPGFPPSAHCSSFCADPSATQHFEGRSPRGPGGAGSAVGAVSAVAAARDQRQLVEFLERHYEAELRRMAPGWLCAGDGQGQPPVSVAETVGVPGVVLGAILAGRCRDQRIPVTPERQKRFAEWMQSHCSSLWFTLRDSSVGPECAKGIVIALALNQRFTSLNLACNSLGDAGAAAIARLLPDHRTLVHMDLSANDIGHHGAAAIFDALLPNTSLTYLDMSSKPGGLRNHLARSSAAPLESLLATNRVLAKLSLAGTAVGPEGAAGLARGLATNTALISLDLASNEIGPKGGVAIAEALRFCMLEELNLADNRMGDEGLLALASRLGALPSSVESAGGANVWATSPEGVKASMKYQEHTSALHRALVDFHAAGLRLVDKGQRHDAFARIAGCATQLRSTVDAAAVAVPPLRVLNLSNNCATGTGVSRIEDALQANGMLERLWLDQGDHRASDSGVRSLITALVINNSLRHLSLNQCRLENAEMVELAKGLAVNQALETLSLRGNRVGEEAASALGALLASSAKSLRQLNLSSCHLDDTGGISLANALASNTTLESLQLRDNCLREAAGRSFAASLRRNTSLTQLPLEMNSIDFRFLCQIKQLLERNTRLREKTRPHVYRQRIEELVDCQREAGVLESILNRNQIVKEEVQLQQATIIQEFREAQREEAERQRQLQLTLAELVQQRKRLDEDISEVRARIRTIRGEGDYEAGQLHMRITAVDDRFRHHERHIQSARKVLAQFEAKAAEEIAALREELERAEKARSSAQLLAVAAQRNLDGFVSSLKSIEKDIAGGSEPRRRMVEAAHGDAVAGGRRSRPRTPNRTGQRPRTPNRAVGAARPRSLGNTPR